MEQQALYRLSTDAAGAQQMSATPLKIFNCPSRRTGGPYPGGTSFYYNFGGFTATEGSGSGANAGTIAIADGGDFIFVGTIDNTGKITLGSTADATQLTLLANGTLSGSGKVTLSDNANNQITASAAATIGSRPRCGNAPWQPRPTNVAWKLSVAASSAPALVATVPIGSPGQP